MNSSAEDRAREHVYHWLRITNGAGRGAHVIGPYANRAVAVVAAEKRRAAYERDGAERRVEVVEDRTPFSAEENAIADLGVARAEMVELKKLIATLEDSLRVARPWVAEWAPAPERWDLLARIDLAIHAAEKLQGPSTTQPGDRDLTSGVAPSRGDSERSR